MVEYTSELDAIFQALSDPVRREVLDMLADSDYTVGEIALQFDISLAAVSKHLQVMERAGLITKQKDGRQRIVGLAPYSIQNAEQYLEQYRKACQDRFALNEE